MGNLMSFKRFLGRFCSSKNVANLKSISSSLGLPENISNLLIKKEARQFRDFIELEYRRNKKTNQVDQLLKQTIDENWPPLELRKISAYKNYFSENFNEALQLSLPYASRQEFDFDLFHIACLSLYGGGRFDEAFEVFSRTNGYEGFIKNKIDYYILGAVVAATAGHLINARYFLERIFEIDPENLVAICNAYPVYTELNDQKEILRLNEIVSEQYSQNPEANFCLASIDLASGNYLSGFRRAECRYLMAEAHRYLHKDLLELPRWNGENLNELKLLIHAEQGLGDTIMYSRYLDKIIENNINAIFECHSEAIPLLRESYPSIDFIPLVPKKMPDCRFDRWIGTMSLPFIFKTTEASVPHRNGYLCIPQEQRGYWQKRVSSLTKRKLKVGLAWAGNYAHRADRRRSIPWLVISEMLDLEDIEFYALQTHVPENHPTSLFDLSDELITLADTAALIGEMDLILTVDTSIVHIAGAIGKQTWLMLPHRYEWRWGLDGDDNNWYESVSVVRQKACGDWVGVLNEIFTNRLPCYLQQFKERLNESV